MDFETAVDLARDAREGGWEVEGVSFRYREAGREVWAVNMRRPNNAAPSRDQLDSQRYWERLQMLTCTHPAIILTAASDGSYMAKAECAECRATVGMDHQPASGANANSSDWNYGSQMATWVAQARSWLHTQSKEEQTNG